MGAALAWARERPPVWKAQVTHLQQWADPAVFQPRTMEAWHRYRARLRARLGVDPQARMVLLAGRLVRQKDSLLMLEAFTAQGPGLAR